MPRRTKTRQESEVLKASMVRLRQQRWSMTEIAREFNVTKQYVSLVLLEAEAGGKPEQRRENPKEFAEATQATIARLEAQGEYYLAGHLRTVLERRSKENRKRVRD